MYVICLVLSLNMPLDEVRHADVIELNHFFDGDGNKILDQWIIWEWQDGRYFVMDWCLKGKECNLRKIKGGWEFTRRMDDGRLVVVEAHEYRETWTQFDPEIANRKWMRVGHRNQLWNVSKMCLNRNQPRIIKDWPAELQDPDFVGPPRPE